MADQTDNPHGAQVAGTVDGLTNEQFAKLIVQGQNAFGLWSPKVLDGYAEVCMPAGIGVALVAHHRDNQQPGEEE